MAYASEFAKYFADYRSARGQVWSDLIANSRLGTIAPQLMRSVTTVEDSDRAATAPSPFLFAANLAAEIAAVPAEPGARAACAAKFAPGHIQMRANPGAKALIGTALHLDALAMPSGLKATVLATPLYYSKAPLAKQRLTAFDERHSPPLAPVTAPNETTLTKAGFMSVVMGVYYTLQLLAIVLGIAIVSAPTMAWVLVQLGTVLVTLAVNTVGLVHAFCVDKFRGVVLNVCLAILLVVDMAAFVYAVESAISLSGSFTAGRITATEAVPFTHVLPIVLALTTLGRNIVTHIAGNFRSLLADAAHRRQSFEAHHEWAGYMNKMRAALRARGKLTALHSSSRASAQAPGGGAGGAGAGGGHGDPWAQASAYLNIEHHLSRQKARLIELEP